MEPWPQLLVVALIGGAIWWAIQPRYAFLIRIAKGEPRIAKGKVTPSFLKEVGEACNRGNVVRGWVGGVRHGQHITLAFSRSIPPHCQQQIRNVWQLRG